MREARLATCRRACVYVRSSGTRLESTFSTAYARLTGEGSGTLGGWGKVPVDSLRPSRVDPVSSVPTTTASVADFGAVFVVSATPLCSQVLVVHSGSAPTAAVASGERADTRLHGSGYPGARRGGGGRLPLSLPPSHCCPKSPPLPLPLTFVFASPSTGDEHQKHLDLRVVRQLSQAADWYGEPYLVRQVSRGRIDLRAVSSTGAGDLRRLPGLRPRRPPQTHAAVVRQGAECVPLGMWSSV